VTRSTIKATDYVDPSESVVDCANRIATAVASRLQAGENVVVSVHDLRGVSSSFFNVILTRVTRTLGPQWTEERFAVDCETKTQRTIYLRSLSAFQASARTG
jgi:hypothetical protein